MSLANESLAIDETSMSYAHYALCAYLPQRILKSDDVADYLYCCAVAARPSLLATQPVDPDSDAYNCDRLQFRSSS